MVVIMHQGAPKREIGQVLAALQHRGLEPRIISPEDRVVIGVVEEMDQASIPKLREALAGLKGVEEVEEFGSAWKLASRDFRSQRTVVRVGERTVGGPGVAVMAGPCAVESGIKSS